MYKNGLMVKVLQTVLSCIYLNLPVTHTEIAFLRGLSSDYYYVNVNRAVIILLGVREHGSPLQYVRGACGDLCDVTRKHVPWNYLNYTVADVRNL